MSNPEPERSPSKLGVIVFNLGGPENLLEVKPFLYRLFSDPEIVRIRSEFLRKAVAYSIATLRNRRSSGYYKKIGGGSPLRRITEERAQALSDELRWAGWNVDVFVGMCTWNPFFEETLDMVEQGDIQQLIILPLFPQFSVTTSGSGINSLRKLIANRPGMAGIDVGWIQSWQDHPTYIEAFTELIRKELEEFADPDSVSILFSAQSIPEQYVLEGDPYLEQTRETVELIAERLGRRNPYRLAFQSKVGPVKLLGPATNDVIVEMGKDGDKSVLIVPVSFVSEHIETLYELDILCQKVAMDAGIEEYRRVRALNCNPTFIRSLREIVESAVAGTEIATES
jgi:ferrochelatase